MLGKRCISSGGHGMTRLLPNAWIALVCLIGSQSVLAQTSFNQLQQAVALHGVGRYDDAIAIYQQLLTHDRKNPLVLYEMANSYYAKLDYASCIQYARQGAKIESDVQSAAYMAWADCLDDSAEHSEALNICAKATKKFPKDARLQYNYGVALIGANRVADAVRALQASIDEAPEYSSPYFSYAAVLGALDSRAGETLMGMRLLIVEPDSDRAKIVAKQLNQDFIDAAAQFKRESAKPVIHISDSALLFRELIGFDLVYPRIAANGRTGAKARGLGEDTQFVWAATALLTVMADQADNKHQDGFIWTDAYNALHTLGNRGRTGHLAVSRCCHCRSGWRVGLARCA
jgi:tetratricopeptide (TPR) repeat protein